MSTAADARQVMRDAKDAFEHAENIRAARKYYEYRDQIDAAIVGDRPREPLALARARQQPQPVAQPFDQAAGDEHRPFERIGADVALLHQHRCEQAIVRYGPRRAARRTRGHGIRPHSLLCVRSAKD